MSDLRTELIQVASVAIAIVTDLDQGSTQLMKPDRLTDVVAPFTRAHKRVMADVELERAMQEDMWGPQHHSPFEWLAILGEEYGEACQAAVDNHAWA